jgi:hypothetical protein
MTITIDPRLEARLRKRAESEGLTVDAHLERLVHSDQAAEQELETLALEGLNSGTPIEAAPALGKRSTSFSMNGSRKPERVERKPLSGSPQCGPRPRRPSILLRD